jgi:hypothetical protein
MKENNLIIKVLTVVFVIALGQLFVCNSNVYGLELIGPPRSIIQEGQSAIGIEAGYGQMDLEASGDVTKVITSPYQREVIFTKYKIKNLESAKFSVRFDTSIYENWDLFVRLGAANASGDIKEEREVGSTSREYQDFDGNYGFSCGIGTRATFYRYKNITLGGSLQFNWTNPGQSDATDAKDPNFSGEAELKYWEVQLAVGPAIEFDFVRVYGGPFLNYIDGDIDISGNSETILSLPLKESSSPEIEEKIQFGGFLGAQWNLENNITLITEGQVANEGWRIGISTSWKF